MDDQDDFHAETAHLSPAAVLAWYAEVIPPADRQRIDASLLQWAIANPAGTRQRLLEIVEAAEWRIEARGAPGEPPH